MMDRTKWLRRVVLTATLATIAAAEPAAAQDRVGTPAVEALLRNVGTGARLRVVDVDGERLDGRYWGVVDGQLRLRPTSGPDLLLGPERVAAVDMRVSSAGSSARIAGIAGAAVGGTLGFAAGALCDYPGCGSILTSVVVGAAIVGGVGAVLGAVVGDLLGAWVPIHPVPPSRGRGRAPDAPGWLRPPASP